MSASVHCLTTWQLFRAIGRHPELRRRCGTARALAKDLRAVGLAHTTAAEIRAAARRYGVRFIGGAHSQPRPERAAGKASPLRGVE